ncbi:MAG: LuxR C-terminal-related transcriptional regulator [Microthrixaceae bacterium]
MHSHLVGRSDERERLRSALANAPAAIVLSGPAGVGKTRLGREVCDELGNERTVVSCFASTAAGEVPFGAFARLVPAPEPGTPADPTAMLRTVAERIDSELDGAAGLLMIDDAHLLDEASVALVHHLIHATPLSVLLTVRADTRAPADIARLWANDRVETLELANLDEYDTAALVGALCGGPVAATTTSDVWQATRGNPLFVRELVLAALGDGRIRNEEGLFRLQGELRAPARLTELVRDQLRAGDPRHFDALELLALTGPVSLDAVDRADVAETAGETIDQLLQAGSVSVSGSGRRREVRLAHPLHEDALTEPMTAIHRRAMQRRAVELLRHSPGPAFRYRETMLRIESGLAVDEDMIEQAAHYALTCFDRSGAEHLVRASLETDADPSVRVELDRVLAKLLRWTGRHDAAETILERSDVAAVDESHAHAEHLIARSENLFRGLLDGAAARELLAGAKHVRWDSADAERLAAFDASLLLLEAQVDRAVPAGETIVEHGSDPAARAMAAVVVSYAQGRAGRFDRAIEAADLADHLAERHPEALSDDPTAPWIGRCLALADSGALDRCDDDLRVGPRGGVDFDRVHWQGWQELITARAEAIRGRMTTAALHAKSAALSFRDHEDRALERVAWAGVARIEGQRGDSTSAAVEAIERAGDIDRGPFRLLDCELAWAEGWVAVAEGRLSAARDTLHDAADVAGSSGQHAIALAIAHDALRIEAHPDTGGLVLRLADRVDGALAGGRATHARAVIANDVDGYGRAAETMAGCGAHLPAAEVLAQGASLARSAGDQRLGRQLAARSVARRRDCEDALTPALRTLREPISLTRREREVASLAANGLTGPEIADRLYVSVRTVNNHLQHVYRKLGIESRSDLGPALDLTAE